MCLYLEMASSFKFIKLVIAILSGKLRFSKSNIVSGPDQWHIDAQQKKNKEIKDGEPTSHGQGELNIPQAKNFEDIPLAKGGIEQEFF